MLCGGNIEPLVLAEIIERGMVKSGRLARLRVDVRDVPGALADVAALLARLGANIDEVQHQRAFTSLSVERVQIEVVVQTRGAEHIADDPRGDARRGLRRRAGRLGLRPRGRPGYLPVQRAGRFSMKARTPSWKSALP